MSGNGTHETPTALGDTSSLPARIQRRIRINPETDCWEWVGYVMPNGYGGTSLRGVAMNAHRAVYTALVATIPAGLHLDHLCRVRHCVNPAHLEPVSAAENTRRSYRDAPRVQASHCKRGHLYESGSYWVYATGARACKACKRIRRAAMRASAA